MNNDNGFFSEKNLLFITVHESHYLVHDKYLKKSVLLHFHYLKFILKLEFNPLKSFKHPD